MGSGCPLPALIPVTNPANPSVFRGFPFGLTRAIYLHAMRTDLVFALRTLRRSPLFTAVAVLCLTLGIGANTAIFSLLDQVLFRNLSVNDPGSLVLLDGPGPNFGAFRGDKSFSYPMYRDLRDHNQVFSGLLARYPVALNLQQDGQAEAVRGELVSGNYFQVLGIGAELGRTLLPADDEQRNAHPVAVLSFKYWMSRFGSDPSIAGRSIRLNGIAMTVVGVVASGFDGVEVARQTDVFVPMMMKPVMTPTWDDLENRRSFWLNAIGRLKPGVSRESAAAGLQPVYRTILEREASEMPGSVSRQFLEGFRARQVELHPGGSGVGRIRNRAARPLSILMAMVGLVLLIACANVANLFMARAAARQKEIAIRLSLGARRGQVIRQLLIESLLLSAAGAAGGLLLATWISGFLLHLLPEQMVQGGISSALDPRVLGFALFLSIATAVLFGLVPAFQATRPRLVPALKDQVSGSRSTWGGLRTRRALVVAQVALSLLLLFGAGLFLRSLQNLNLAHPGFQSTNLIGFRADAAQAGYAPGHALQIYDRMTEALTLVPGVTAVTTTTLPLLTGQFSFATVRVQGYESKPGEDMNPQVAEIGPRYFETLRIPLLLGREFTPADQLGAPGVAIVNKEFADYFFKGESPLGRRFGIGDRNDQFEIVGVVSGGKYNSMRDQNLRHFYLPWHQMERPEELTFYIRTEFEGPDTFQAIRASAAFAAPGVALTGMRTMEDQLRESLAHERLIALLCALFGAVATLLASIGLYGVTAFSVARRTREFGIRVALGAGTGSVVSLVLREAGWMTAVGLGVGLPLSLAFSRLIASQLYGLQPHDPVTLVSASVTIAFVSLLAGWIPARRAARVDPLTALRYE